MKSNIYSRNNTYESVMVYSSIINWKSELFWAYSILDIFVVYVKRVKLLISIIFVSFSQTRHFTDMSKIRVNLWRLLTSVLYRDIEEQNRWRQMTFLLVNGLQIIR